MTVHVSGIVLAAGRSARLGRPKQLLQLGGEPVIKIVTRNALAAGLSDVILVTGHEAAAVAAAAMPGVRVVANPDYALGQSTSVRAGVKAVAPGADGFMILLGDQPGVNAAMMRALIDAFDASRQPIVQAMYGDTPGNPVVFRRDLADELLAIAGDEGARSVIRAHKDDVLCVRVGDGPPPRDIDTEEDYLALKAIWGEPA